MITPRFNLSQTDRTLMITVRAPYCSLRELDISVEDNAFIFFCRPYYLRLNLPGNILENDRTNSKFDSDKGEFIFTYEKEHPGEHFKDLEYISKFLCTKMSVEEGDRKIELLVTEENVSEEEVVISEEFGFAMRGGYNINNLDEEFPDVFKINPREVKLEERASLRLKNEKIKFNSEHYLADFIDHDEIMNICNFQCPWQNINGADVDFTSKELDFLKDLSNVEYNLTAKQICFCHNNLLEILYAYCYDRRTTCFEGTCESGWTISTISATLSWFDGFSDVKSAIICAYRRSLIFPLYRSFKLSEQVFKDLKMLLALGEKFLIKSLIEMYYIFIDGDSGRFILNNLFIKDYIMYIMKWNKDLWTGVVNEVNSVIIEKDDLGLGLVEIERSADTFDVANNLDNLKLESSDSNDSTDSDDTFESDDDSSDSYSLGEDLPEEGNTDETSLATTKIN